MSTAVQAQRSLRVHFEVDTNGRPNHITHEGNGIFAASVDSALGRTTLPANCNETFDLVYKFVLGGKEEDETHTFVVFHPPNEYVINSNPTGIICVMNAEPRRSWLRRLFDRKPQRVE